MTVILSSYPALGEEFVEESSGEERILERDHLLGDWWGKRSFLEEKGLTFEFIYKGDVFGNFRGGLKQGATYLGNFDMTLTFDTEKAGWWKGGEFFVYGLNNHGGQPSANHVGDIQVVDNIEANSTWRLFKLWYEQKFFGEILSVLVGQYAQDGEFHITEYGSLFLNSSFGTPAVISLNSQVSIFPVATLGGRVKWKPADFLTLMAAVYDGNPGTPRNNSAGINWELSAAEGVMTIYEAGFGLWQSEESRFLPGTYKLGFWYHTDEFDDVTVTTAAGNPVRHEGNYGVYVVADQMVYREDKDQGLGVFVQIGGAPGDRSLVDFYFGGGVHYLGLISGRDEDEIGIAVAHASISDQLRRGGGWNASETALEVTYLAQIFPWFSVQPDLQFIINPGAVVPALNNSVVFLTRLTVNL